uniref:PARP catalytic domain-containing protein n=1 Tax=Biomphalaria glabrata TaxID=6526 RepID=A0A2C9L1U3_BIOGL
MAVSLQKEADPYLRKAISVLEAYCNTIKEITDQPLNLQIQHFVLHINFVIEIDYPFVKIQAFNTISRGHSLSLNSITTQEALWSLEVLAVYTETLNNVLAKYFKAQKDLKKKDMTKKTEILGELKRLKDGIDAVLALIDKIMEYYNFKPVEMNVNEKLLPSLDELQTQKDFVCAIKKKLKLDKLHEIFSEYKGDFKVSDATILCSILGLQEDYRTFLDTLQAEGEDHREDCYYIIKLLESKEQDLNYDTNDMGIAGLSKNLVSLGFTQARASAIAKNIPSELIDLQMPSFWAERYLENAYLYHPLLSAVSRYPYSEDEKDKWFQKEIPTDQRDEPNEDIKSFKIRMLNSTSKSPVNNKLVEDYLGKVKDEDKDSVLLFHGTTHAGAESILTSGITLTAGQKGQDFSSGDGFYLSEKLEDADKWSGAARGEHKAVVVFKVKKEMLDARKENGLDLTGDQGMWQSVVKICRNQYHDKKAKAKLLKGVSFIKGNLCLNPKDYTSGKSNAEGFGQNEVQFCIRDEDYSVKFGSLQNVCCVVFY